MGTVALPFFTTQQNRDSVNRREKLPNPNLRPLLESPPQREENPFIA